PLLIGSIKSNIGHTQAAAGAAGLIKVLLALQNEGLPKNLHFTEPNPLIPWSELPVQVLSQEKSWKRGSRKRPARRSCFGISGTNAHVIIEEPPALRLENHPDAPQDPYLLLLSARAEKSLRTQAGAYASHMKQHSEQNLEDICYSALSTRDTFNNRLA